MTQNTLCAPVNNIICEAYGCFEKATTKTKVRVGHLGSISLDLCTNCVGKFDENDDGESDLKQKIVRNEEDKGR
jgi:hypothetical protein